MYNVNFSLINIGFFVFHSFYIISCFSIQKVIIQTKVIKGSLV